MRFQALIGPGLLASSAPLVQAATHYIITGTYTNLVLYTLAFDDETYELTLAANTTTPTSHQWIALSHDKKNLYATSTTATQTEYVSYTLEDATSIVYNTTTVSGDCIAKTVHVDALQVPPYTVYGYPWYGDEINCGGAMAVNDQGVIVENIQNYSFPTGSGLHGLAFHPSGDFLYSADLLGENIWTHAIDRTTGEVTEVGNSSSGAAGPREVAAHPAGRYIYAMDQYTIDVAVYAIDNATGVAALSNVSYSILPSADTENGGGATVELSASNTLLYASTRGGSSVGYVSGFTLNADGSIASQDWIEATSTGGAGSNQVVPSGFDDNFFALVDNSEGFVEVWKRNGDASGAAVVAHLQLDSNGCCSNAVWYS